MKTNTVFRALFIIMMVGAIFSMNAYGRNPDKATKYPTHARQIKSILENTVKFPECGMSVSGQGIAEVIFSISDNGKIDIYSVTANCKDLEVYVKEQLDGLSFEKVNYPKEQHYRVTFIFCQS